MATYKAVQGPQLQHYWSDGMRLQCNWRKWRQQTKGSQSLPANKQACGPLITIIQQLSQRCVSYGPTRLQLLSPATQESDGSTVANEWLIVTLRGCKKHSRLQHTTSCSSQMQCVL